MHKRLPESFALLLVCVVTLVVCLCRAATADSAYRVRVLDDLGSRGSVACSINNLGHTVGLITDWNDTTSAVIWRDAPAQFAGDLGGSYSSAAGINDSDQVVGTASLPGGGWHAFLWSNGQTQDLSTLGGLYSNALAINNNGQVVGNAVNADDLTEAFMWDGEMHPLGFVPGGTYSNAAAISDSGYIAGSSGGAAFFANNNVEVVPGSEYGFTSVNDMGQAVAPVNYPNADGSIAVRASLWDGSVWRDLGALGGPWPENHCSNAYAINSLGQIVGDSTTDDSFQSGSVTLSAFLWENGVMQRLPSLPGQWGSVAYDINDSGLIAGAVIGVDGYLHAVIWEPVPEPSAFVVLLFGMFGMAGAMRKTAGRARG